MKRFLVAILVIVTVLLASAAAFFFGIGYYLSPQSTLTKVDAIVAISGGDTAARTNEAVTLYKDGWGANIIFSGAALDPSSPSNAKIMSQLAIADGVPAAAIALDEAATNTRQNATGTAAIIHAANYHSIILVTSPYHQRRAYINFRRVLGPSTVIINHSSYDATWRRSDWWATPLSRTLTSDELQKVAYELLSGQSQ
jgi:uncharacterized SAM-binding protein YcdF (DUF218 family)